MCLPWIRFLRCSHLCRGRGGGRGGIFAKSSWRAWWRAASKQTWWWGEDKGFDLGAGAAAAAAAAGSAGGLSGTAGDAKVLGECRWLSRVSGGLLASLAGRDDVGVRVVGADGAGGAGGVPAVHEVGLRGPLLRVSTATCACSCGCATCTTPRGA